MSISSIKNNIIHKNKIVELPETVKDIYDIINYVDFNIKDNYIYLKYKNLDKVIKLGYCSFYITGKDAIVDEFYTANFNGIDFNDQDLNLQAINDIDVLKKPLPYIGKELFGKLICILRADGVKSIGLIYCSDTKSIKFYKKMQNYFSNQIQSITEPIKGALIIKLI